MRLCPDLKLWVPPQIGHIGRDWFPLYRMADPRLQERIDRALAFLGRYVLFPGEPLHRSATSVVVLATEIQEDTAKNSTDQESQGTPVALKLMGSEDQFNCELRTRKIIGLNSRFVLSMTRAHTMQTDYEIQDLQGGAPDIVAKLRPEHNFELPEHLESTIGGCYAFCLVMERADRNLASALTHENFAGENWDYIRIIARDLISAADHMHAKGVCHCDVKPLNIVRHGNAWKLIDMDVAAGKGERFGGSSNVKAPSSGYAPPEMASLLLRTIESKTDGGDGNTACLTEYVASPAYDLWSVGCVLFHMCTGISLWHTDQNDNANLDDLHTLANLASDPSPLYRRLRQVDSDERGHSKGGRDAILAHSLLLKLLNPNPERRLAAFQGGIGEVLKDPFFEPANCTMSPNDLEDLRRDMQMIFDVVNSSMDKSLQMLKAHGKMLEEVLTGVKAVPSLVIFLPVERRWLKNLRDPAKAVESMIGTQVKLHFVCALSYEVCSEGFDFLLEREWFKKVAPCIKAGVMALKVGAALGKLSGLPIPDLGSALQGFLENTLSSMDATLTDVAKDMQDWANDRIGVRAFAALRQAISFARDRSSRYASQFGDELEQGIEESGQGGPSEANNQQRLLLNRSSGELASLLDNKHPGWEKRTGLVKAVHQGTGDVVWCHPDLKQVFERHGHVPGKDYWKLCVKEMVPPASMNHLDSPPLSSQPNGACTASQTDMLKNIMEMKQQMLQETSRNQSQLQRQLEHINKQMQERGDQQRHLQEQLEQMNQQRLQDAARNQRHLQEQMEQMNRQRLRDMNDQRGRFQEQLERMNRQWLRDMHAQQKHVQEQLERMNQQKLQSFKLPPI
uniref:Serine threonine protein kinase n=2 Tax=Tetraselmis sp. GSL018 TaxID=582737 RepID=A0A061QGB0_9CHLO